MSHIFVELKKKKNIYIYIYAEKFQSGGFKERERKNYEFRRKEAELHACHHFPRKYEISNWILTSCQSHMVTSGGVSNKASKQTNKHSKTRFVALRGKIPPPLPYLRPLVVSLVTL